MKIKNTIICETTLAAAAPFTPMPNPNPPYSSKSKIKIGSNMALISDVAIIIKLGLMPSPLCKRLNAVSCRGSMPWLSSGTEGHAHRDNRDLSRLQTDTDPSTHEDFLRECSLVQPEVMIANAEP